MPGPPFGYLLPGQAVGLKVLGDGFIRLIQMMLAPVIFTTVVLGIAKMESMKELDRVGVKALLYFELLSTLALVIGLVVVNLVQPGAGLNADPHTLDARSVAQYTRGHSVGCHADNAKVERFANMLAMGCVGRRRG